jgi:uncharacterized membrane protein
VALFLACVWLSSLGNGAVSEDEAALTPAQQRFTQAEGFEDVAGLIMGNCSMCHAAEPGFDGIYHAPKGVKLETEGEIAAHAREIYLQAGVSSAMPPPSASYLTAEDRQTIVRWYRAATGTEMASVE